MAAPDLGISSLDNSLRANLFKLAMEGDWDNIVYSYNEALAPHFQKITWLGDTALHMAVADGLQDVVESLLEGIFEISIETEDEPALMYMEDDPALMHVEDDPALMHMEEEMKVGKGIDRFNNVLKIKNSDGNTPLHVAASMGGIAMCAAIVCADRYIDYYHRRKGEELETARKRAQEHISELIGERNNAGETPLFLAAHMGHKDAFLFLTEICGHRETEVAYEYCTRKDGKTILHTAISGLYIDLAFQIICLYKHLVERVNESGDTPLEALARKPSAFKSGSKLGRWEKLVYECIPVKELKEDFSYAKNESGLKDVGKENHYAWSSCLQFLRNVIPLVNPRAHASGSPKADLETPLEYDTGKQSASGGAQSALWSRLVKQITMSMLVILGMGRVNRVKQQKEKHIWSVQVMQKLIENSTTLYVHERGGEFCEEADTEILEGHFKEEKEDGKTEIIFEKRREEATLADNPSRTKMVSTLAADEPSRKETAILIAAKNGIKEMVAAILRKFPVAVYDLNAEKKNIVLLAVETRQIDLYKMLLDSSTPYNVPSKADHSQPFAPGVFYQEKDQKPAPIHVKDNAFRMVDSNGNSALHLAAKLMEDHKPWQLPGAALKMQWEIKWLKFVERSMPPNFFVRYNEKGEAPEQVFTESHKKLVQEGGEWLIHTSESCSVVAALIATVAFATSTAIPGGTNDQNGKPTLENQFAFKMFGITSLVSLCFSVTSMSMFLSILTSRFEEKDFGKSLPWKVLLGLTSLFVSIASVLVSFCSGHFFVLRDTLKYAAFPVYAVTCLPITFFAAAQFPLYFDLIRATFRSPFGESSRRKMKFKELKQKWKKLH